MGVLLLSFDFEGGRWDLIVIIPDEDENQKKDVNGQGGRTL